MLGLDDGHVHAQLGSTDGRNVPTGATADDNKIETICHGLQHHGQGFFDETLEGF